VADDRSGVEDDGDNVLVASSGDAEIARRLRQVKFLGRAWEEFYSHPS
jgi:hypothetical protein